MPFKSQAQRPSSRSCWSKGREQTRHSKNGIERPALRNCPSASRREDVKRKRITKEAAGVEEAVTRGRLRNRY